MKFFDNIDQVLHPQNAQDVSNQGPISTKNPKEGDACWITHKVLFGWALDTANHLSAIILERKEKLEVSLN